MVPFLDLKTQYRALAGEIDPAVTRVMASGSFILGEEGKAFEAEFGRFLGCPHVAGVSSGLDALRLALLALGIGPGDEVITAANTFIATALAVTSTGATPVLVDPDEATSNVTAEQMARAITPKTRALIPVHLYGLPVDMGPVMELAKKHGLVVIEDACQAHGATIHGKAAGTFGDAGCFSFYPGKNLGAYGDGGAVVTNRPEIDRKIRMLRNYGQEKKYYHPELGYNHRLDEIQAAVLRVKLSRLAGWNEARRRHAAAYGRALAGLPLGLPVVPEGLEHIYHLYVVRTPERDRLQAHLTERGVGCLIHYPVPIHLQEAYRSLGKAPGAYPVAETLAREILSLPMFPELTEGQIEEVTGAVRSFFAGRA